MQSSVSQNIIFVIIITLQNFFENEAISLYFINSELQLNFLQHLTHALSLFVKWGTTLVINGKMFLNFFLYLLNRTPLKQLKYRKFQPLFHINFNNQVHWSKVDISGIDLKLLQKTFLKERKKETWAHVTCTKSEAILLW
jgi:hypothetical protein